jgi:hypothetical protein
MQDEMPPGFVIEFPVRTDKAEPTCQVVSIDMRPANGLLTDVESKARKRDVTGGSRAVVDQRRRHSKRRPVETVELGKMGMEYT